MLEFFTSAIAVPGIELRIVAALAFAGAAAYFDYFNKKWVPNYLLYGFVGAAIILNIVFFDPTLSLQALAFGALAFALSYPLYRMGQLGGADAYVIAGIAATIPFLQQPLLAPAQSVPYPFILSVFAPTGIAFILHTSVRFIPFVASRISKGGMRFGVKRLAGPALLCVAFAFFIYSLSSLPILLPPSYFALVSFLFVSLLFFSTFKEEIKDSMVEMVPASRLAEEDVLALEKMDRKLVEKLSLSPLLSKKSIALLRKSRQKSFPVYTGMPMFLPHLFIGLLFSVLFGDLLYYLMAGSMGFAY